MYKSALKMIAVFVVTVVAIGMFSISQAKAEYLRGYTYFGGQEQLISVDYLNASCSTLASPVAQSVFKSEFQKAGVQIRNFKFKYISGHPSYVFDAYQYGRFLTTMIVQCTKY